MDREAIGTEIIHATLDALLNLPPLRKSPQLSAFLAYVVRESLAGRGSLLKSYTIATDALGRSTSFDPATDAIVRVEARRLRQVLQQIYADPACPLDVRIDLPLGRYEPSFRQIAPLPGSAAPASPQEPATNGMQESEQRYRALVEASAAVEWRSGPDGSLIQTFGLSTRTGLTDAELLGFGWLAALHPDDRAAVGALWRACCQSGTPLDATYRVRHRCGEYRWMLGRAVPLESAEGTIREWVGTMADIDEQIRAAEALRTSEERLRLAIAAAGMMTWDVDVATREVTCSEFGASLMGATTGSLDELFLAMVVPEDLPAVLASLEPALRGEGTYDAQYRITHEDGVRWISARGSLMTSSDGRTRLIGVACDISGRYAVSHLAEERRLSA